MLVALQITWRFPFIRVVGWMWMSEIPEEITDLVIPLVP